MLNNNLFQRIITSLILIPIVLFILYYGKFPFLILIFIITGGCLIEFYNFLIKKQYFVPKWLFILNGFLFFIPLIFPTLNLNVNEILIFILLSFFIAKLFNFKNALASIGAGFLGIIYSNLLIYLIYLRNLNNGFYVCLLLFLIIWGNDSGAFFIGKKFGKHKLFPKISPKKSYEGAIAGLIFSLIIAIVMGFILNYYHLNFLNLTEMGILGIVISIIGQIGDAVESIFKRDVSIKDSGNIILGHGGILDRVDSLLLATPIVYYILTVIFNLR